MHYVFILEEMNFLLRSYGADIGKCSIIWICGYELEDEQKDEVQLGNYFRF